MISIADRLGATTTASTCHTLQRHDGPRIIAAVAVPWRRCEVEWYWCHHKVQRSAATATPSYTTTTSGAGGIHNSGQVVASAIAC
jgi:hypothetical protein